MQFVGPGGHATYEQASAGAQNSTVNNWRPPCSGGNQPRVHSGGERGIVSGRNGHKSQGIDGICGGGEGGIRTHVPLTGQDAFEAPPLRPLRYLSVEDCALKRTFKYNVRTRCGVSPSSAHSSSPRSSRRGAHRTPRATSPFDASPATSSRSPTATATWPCSSAPTASS